MAVLEDSGLFNFIISSAPWLTLRCAYCTGTGIIKFCLAVPAVGKVRSKSIVVPATCAAGYHDAHVLKT